MLGVDCGTGHKEARKKIRTTSWGNADREGKGPQNKEESMTFILVSSMLINYWDNDREALISSRLFPPHGLLKLSDGSGHPRCARSFGHR